MKKYIGVFIFVGVVSFGIGCLVQNFVFSHYAIDYYKDLLDYKNTTEQENYIKWCESSGGFVHKKYGLMNEIYYVCEK